jgi:imidazolonepropionase-like amidohydrolase
VLRAADAGVPIPEHVLVKATDVVETHRESIRRAAAAGVRIAMGTDAGVVPHGTNLEELQLMQDIGMSPADVLVATTKTAAELMGLERELGTLEPGKRADLVVVAGDALDFTALPSRIERVYKDGELVVEAAAEPVPVAL